MHSISETIRIDASPERVWEVLADLDSYPQWNPFIREAAGALVAGSRLTIKLFPGTGGRPSTFRPVVRVVRPGRELCWKGKVLVPGLLDGEHRFEIEADGGDACVVTQSERFTGLLVPLLGKTIERTTADFRALNQALRRRAEDGR
ncbi:SRPBCC domain-containing protein [Actinomadura rupiterrae]|uniref:SRPBCC domain-containing protein n=1 Tax=Actinomadura rupiterrae TaxID=559627 RepID=UPI0020A442A9|nr:SRPBCC domain-containing protein [Actinomadura rupiterrae]MCP2343631.1 hypothetical protein [Actinomadura rupiterrae]